MAFGYGIMQAPGVRSGLHDAGRPSVNVVAGAEVPPLELHDAASATTPRTKRLGNGRFMACLVPHFPPARTAERSGPGGPSPGAGRGDPPRRRARRERSDLPTRGLLPLAANARAEVAADGVADGVPDERARDHVRHPVAVAIDHADADGEPKGI